MRTMNPWLVVDENRIGWGRSGLGRLAYGGGWVYIFRGSREIKNGKRDSNRLRLMTMTDSKEDGCYRDEIFWWG